MPRSTTPGSGTDLLIWLGLVAAILFFVATGAAAYLNFQTLKSDSALVVRSGDTLTALEDVLSTVKDAETGQRGYLLTDKDTYLGPYNTAVKEIGSRLDALQRLTLDNPAQQDRLGSLKQHVGAKLEELKRTIDLRRAQGQAAAIAEVQTDRGKQDMDAIRDRGLRDGARRDRSARRAACGNGRRLLAGDRERHHFQPSWTRAHGGRGLFDLARRGRPTSGGLAPDRSRRALEGDAR